MDDRKSKSDLDRDEKYLSQSEEKFAKIFRLSPDSIVVSRLKDGVFIDANQSFLNQTGYSLPELIGHSALPGDIGLWIKVSDRQEFVKELQENGEVLGREFSFRRKNGTVFQGAISSRIMEIEGQPYTLTLIHDITERKIFLDALTQSQQRYKLVFDNMFNGFALHEIALDDSGRPVDYVFLEVNQAFERMVGLKREQIIGRKVTEVLPGIQDDQVDWIGKYGAVAAGKGDLKFESYSSALNKWFGINAFSPRPGQFVTVFEDITERKQMENALREAEARYRLLFELSPEGVVIIDPQTAKLVEFNEAAHRQLGYSREEFSALSIYDLEVKETPDETKEHIAKVVSGERIDFETQQRTRQGQVKDILVTAQMIEILGRQVYYCIWRDITERKSADTENLKRAKELEVFYKASIGREERIIELKQEIENLRKQLRSQ